MAEVEVSRDDLLRPAAAAARLAGGGRLLLPAAARLRLEAAGSSLAVGTAALDASFAVRIPARVCRTFTVLVDAGAFYRLVSALPPGPVRLGAGRGALQVEAGPFRAGLPTADPEDALPPPAPFHRTPGTLLELDPEDLRTALRQTLFAAAPAGGGRPALEAVLLRLEPGPLLAASDRLRLSVRRLRTAGPAAFGGDALIPTRALHELARWLHGAAAAAAKLPPDGARALFHIEHPAGAVELEARLLGERFPGFEHLIPSPADAAARAVLTAEFAAAVQTAARWRPEPDAVLHIHLDPAAQTARLRLRTPSSAGLEAAFPAAVEGRPAHAAFNPTLLMEAVSAAEPPIELHLYGPDRPAAFEKAADGFIHLLMPLAAAE